MSAEWAGVIIAALTLLVTLGSGVGGSLVKWLRKDSREARSRLQVTTTRWPPNGLRLQFDYRPEFTHAAIKAQVAIKTPKVVLYAGRPEINPAPMATGGYIKFVFDGPCIEAIGTVMLTPIDNSGLLKGVMFLLPDGSGDWILRNAEIEVLIADAFGKRLVKQSLSVSPIGENPHTVFVQPAPIQQIILS